MRTRSRATEDRAPKRRKKMAASRRSSSDTSSFSDTSSSSSSSSASSSSRTSLTSDDNETAGQSDWCPFLTAEEKRWMRGERDAASAGATQEVVIDDEDCDQMVRAAQLEEDEAFARSLQAQFDQEEVESHHHHHFGRDGSPPPRQTGGRRRRRNAVAAPQHDFSGDDYEALLAFEERQGAVVSKKLTRGEVQRFPVKCYDGGGGNTQCQICFCDYERGERLRMLPCFHDYHADCVDRWLQENATCPICRVDLADL
ncbi:serine/arginine repetitive matrix protein 2-like isoform X2 [Corythoichthys intestinalis]|nr:serine/arginine repetitive matrix protein 2-like isoform X2 [Corythoichthys intestinalis]